ncbi:MAG: iron-sulfur cluster assembly scaffold protein [Anaerolineae bacterium]|nr:iron-sulfur cluster assembly scaffold protein [Anaerolineae bacterium]
MADQSKRNSDFDQFVTQLQQEIDAQERATYSAKVIEHSHHPTHFGRMDAPDTWGKVQGWCGDMMEMYLCLDGDGIREATFVTDGCGPTLACGNVLSSMVEGLSLAEASCIMPEVIIAALDGLPKEHEHCAELAVSTLQNALFNLRGRDNR